ncbi:MAG: DUF1963 domain-containing protein [Clostridia bacterium]|nr:DUF1963 domain-containing protein [Clostridia bacterium]
MFGFNKLDKVLRALRRNEITVTAKKSEDNGVIYRSKFGGMPALPVDFEWPRFESKNLEGESASRPLSFLCQINLAEIHPYDRENLLPETGLLLFFYEQDSQRWGFGPEDEGCSRVYYFENVDKLKLTDIPEDLNEEYRVKEYSLSFSANDSYPSYEELEIHSDIDCDWDDYDEAVMKKGYDIEYERHKLLGYADLIQGEMLTECERISRGLYCGDAESYRNTSQDIKKSASEWILLFQMMSIQDGDFELMLGDCGNIYFYIRKEELKQRNFNKVWLVLQCG